MPADGQLFILFWGGCEIQSDEKSWISERRKSRNPREIQSIKATMRLDLRRETRKLNFTCILVTSMFSLICP